jgi:nucleotide-binding universal stress UspA family protein
VFWLPNAIVGDSRGLRTRREGSTSGEREMFDTIVVPVDGSAFGELALPVGLGIGCKTGGEVRVVTIITPIPFAHTPGEAEVLAAEVEGLDLAREKGQEYLAELQKRMILSGCDVPISCHVEVGAVTEKLVDHAKASRADLVVLTTHGRGPLQRAWLGSVADSLLRWAPCPVLAIRPKEGEKAEPKDMELRHILVTLDGSGESREILPLAKALAKLFDSRMTLLRVIPPPYPVPSPYIPHAAQEFKAHAAETEAAHEALEKEAAALAAEGLRVEVETRPGAHPAQGILEFAAEAGVDLIAMATRGRGGVSRLVLGSVADKVIRGGTVPVLFHRSP